MPTPVRLFAAVALALLVSACTSRATDDRSPGPSGTGGASPQSGTAGTAGTSGTSATSEPINRDALQALDRMSAYLQTLTAFQIAAETTRDDVLDDGQRIQYGGHVDMLVRRPNRLRVELISDRQHRMFFYDGAAFTIWARRMNYYATVPAPATLAELTDRLQDKYAIEMPLADLFYWSSGHRGASITAAADIGPSQIEGVTCEHYAFRQADVDWQVWLQQGSYPLPRKLIITTTNDAARPQYTTVMTWNLAPSFNDAAFTFEPSADAHRIVLSEAAGTSDRSQP
jgi:hypothetical protein